MVYAGKEKPLGFAFGFRKDLGWSVRTHFLALLFCIAKQSRNGRITLEVATTNLIMTVEWAGVCEESGTEDLDW
jgi:hypothetical protein